MKKDHDIGIRRGTKNIFADLRFPDAEFHLLKAELVTRLQSAINTQELTQTAAASRMGVSQSEVSRLLKGQFSFRRAADADADAVRLRCGYQHSNSWKGGSTTAYDPPACNRAVTHSPHEPTFRIVFPDCSRLAVPITSVIPPHSLTAFLPDSELHHAS